MNYLYIIENGSIQVEQSDCSYCIVHVFHCATTINIIMTTLLIGILLGWLIPRPAVLGKLEVFLWKPVKNKLPKSILKHFG